jgi:hypothetical protein
VAAFVTAGAGFLLAVLWFDLMFDVQLTGHDERELPEALLASIAGYYGRVTTAARPTNRLIAPVMVATLAAIVAEIATGDAPRGSPGPHSRSPAPRSGSWGRAPCPPLYGSALAATPSPGRASSPGRSCAST